VRGASAYYIGGAVACTAEARQALTPGCDDALKVRRCRLTVSKSVLKAPLVSALETGIL